jgi:PAS domain S-box-containing protein
LAYLVAASLIISRLFDLTSDIKFLVLENEKAQNALYLNKELTRLIIDSAYDPFVFIDTNGLITDWNTQAVKTFGWTREEVIGKDAGSLILLPEQTQAELKLNLRNYLQGNSTSFKNSLESKVKSRTGREFLIELAICPFKLANKIEFIIIFKPQIYVQNGKEQKDEIKAGWPKFEENGKEIEELQNKFKAGRILIVDDDDIIHSTLERILLEEDKYVIDHAYSGREGLDKVSSDYNVVICDIRMPDINGLEVLKEIRRRKINAEVFMITGYASPSSEMQAFNYGTSGYLTKPLANISELRSKIHKAVELSMKQAS